MTARVREIRVHGVSGTPPHAMLGVADYQVEQVSGDDITGLFACREGSRPRGVEVPQDVEVVAYSWGALTSGAAGFLGGLRRAMWLTLLPFALGNLAYWARPDLDERGRTRVATAIAVREASLLLTLVFAAAMCLIGIDMIAWQCFRGGTPVCPALPGQLGFLGRPPWDAASVRILIGSVLPFAALALLWWLSRASRARYEAQESDFQASGGLGVLSRRRMWAGEPRTARLQRLHVAAGLLLVVLFGLVPAVRYAPHGVAWWAALAVSVWAALLLAAAAWAVAASFRDGVDFPGVHVGTADRVSRWLPWLAVAAVGMYTVVLLLVDIPERFDDPGLVQGRNSAVGVLICAGILIVAWLALASDHPVMALALPAAIAGVAALSVLSVIAAIALGAGLILVAALFQRRRKDPEGVPRAWHGSGAAMVLGAAVWIAVLFTTSLVVFVGNWLNGSQTVTQLQSSFDPAASPGAFAARVQAQEPLLLATGQVLVRDAVLERSGPDLYLLRTGTVTAVSVTAADGDMVRATPDLDLTGGLLLVDDPPVQVVNSCIVEPGASCDTRVDTWVYTLGGPLAITGPVSVRVGTVPQEPIVVPQVLIWASGLTVAWALAALVIIGIGGFVFVVRARSAVSAQVVADGVHEADRRRSTRSRALAGFSHRAERLLALLAVATSACGVLLTIGAVSGWAPWRENNLAAALVNVGLWLAMLLSAALIVLVGKLMQAAGFWRAVGVLWDLTTFWPRVAHPLGPPCYAERVVPEVVDEVMHSPPDTQVILSGHSQGSLISVAVLSQVASIRGHLNDVRFVAYGSQLRTWYGRIFPAVLGPQILGNAPMPAAPPLTNAAPDAPDPGTSAQRFGGSTGVGLAGLLAVGSDDPRWVTLFRRTDPIGFRVFGDEGSDVDRYVSEYDPPGGSRTHSDFQFSDVYGDLVSRWYRG